MRRRLMYLLAGKGGQLGEVERHTFTLASALAHHDEIHVVADKSYQGSCPKGLIFHAIDLTQSRWNPLLYWQLAQQIQHIQPHLVDAQSEHAANLLSWLKWGFRRTIFVASLHHPPAKTAIHGAMDGVCVVNIAKPTNMPAHRQCQLLYSPRPLPPSLSGQQKNAIREALLQGSEQPLVLAIVEFASPSAMEVVLHAFVGVNAQLVIVADTVAQQTWQGRINDLRLEEQVQFLEPRHDITPLMQAVDICLFPTPYESVLPPVMIEALLVGCPLLAVETDGVREWLSPGVLVSPNDVDAWHSVLCATLRRLATLRQNYLPMFLRARQELTIDGMVQRTHDFYEQLLEHSR